MGHADGAHREVPSAAPVVNVAPVLAALGDESRLQIVRKLSRAGPLSITQLDARRRHVATRNHEASARAAPGGRRAQPAGGARAYLDARAHANSRSAPISSPDFGTVGRRVDPAEVRRRELGARDGTLVLPGPRGIDTRRGVSMVSTYGSIHQHAASSLLALSTRRNYVAMRHRGRSSSGPRHARELFAFPTLRP